jgi:hypothetical protein
MQSRLRYLNKNLIQDRKTFRRYYYYDLLWLAYFSGDYISFSSTTQIVRPSHLHCTCRSDTLVERRPLTDHAVAFESKGMAQR